MDQVQLKKIEAIRDWFVKQNCSLGFAESCTGGLVSSVITSVPGASGYFKGSIISYSRELKQNLLGVPSTLIDVTGQVSLPVAKSMAIGARKSLNTTWAMSITGVAGPSGGSIEKPVGTICFALSGPGIVKTYWKSFEARGTGSAQRSFVQEAAVNFVIDTLHELSIS